jgi:uncharacterized membrane protein
MKTNACYLCRFLDHTLVWRPSYKRVFNAQCMAAITQAVGLCEKHTQVQVCVIAEQTLPYSYLRKRLSVRDRAITLFGKHRVWDTQANCGVLIYVNMVEHGVEIVADRGIAPLIAQPQWNEWASQLNKAFAQQQFQAGLVQVIGAMTQPFANALPRLANQPLDAANDAPIVL